MTIIDIGANKCDNIILINFYLRECQSCIHIIFYTITKLICG